MTRPAAPMIAIGALVLAQTANAQDAGAGADDGAIIVTAEALPDIGARSVYGVVERDARDIADEASPLIEGALGSVAGFQQFRRSDNRSANASAQGATLRSLGGNAASRALATLDGVPLSDPFFGFIPYSAIEPSTIASIRVARGPGGGAFAAGALAGTIEMRSLTGAARPGLAARAALGSFSSVDAGVNVTHRVGESWIGIDLSGERSDGFFTVPDNERTENDVRASGRSGAARLTAFAPLGPRTGVTARIGGFRDKRTLRFEGADTVTRGLDSSITLTHRGRWQVEGVGYVQARDFSNLVVSSTSFRPVLDQRDTPSRGIGAGVELRPPVAAPFELRLGLDARRAEGVAIEDQIGFATGRPVETRRAGGTSLTAGGFAEAGYEREGWTISAGIRADRWSLTDGRRIVSQPGGAAISETRYPERGGWELTGRAGVSRALGGGFSLRGAAYTGWRLPTLNELYRPFTVFPVTTLANAELRPERLLGGEIGARYERSDALAFSITAFDNRLENAISNLTIGPDLRQRRNVDAIDTRGVEIDAEARWRAFDVRLSYAYADARVDAPGEAIDGMRPAQAPRHLASATLGWRPREDARIAATLRHTGRQFEDDLEADALPAATVLDLSGSLRLTGSLSLHASAENIFDEEVVTRIADARTETGTPRTLWVGLRFER